MTDHDGPDIDMVVEVWAEYIPRALRCACTDAHHYRGSALCPLTPADPWGVDGETP